MTRLLHPSAPPTLASTPNATSGAGSATSPATTAPAGPDLTPVFIDAGRKSFLRAAMSSVAERANGRPIALYGGGRHTTVLFRATQGYVGMPIIRFILDDAANGTWDIGGVPVVPPAQAPDEDLAMILVSSDSIEDLLARRAEEWVRRRWTGARAAAAPPVVKMYNGDAALAIGAHADQFRGTWGSPTTMSSDHLPMRPDQRVLRLPPAPPRAGAGTTPADFTLPPPALRAGYCVDSDAQYLRSGATDVASIRTLIERWAPGFRPRRVLDWGCSSGRLIRHWGDLAAAGGEVWGTDLCATALNWAAEHLAPPFRFFQGTTRPRIPLPDASLDLVYANSVFTHIRDLWDAWLVELRRVIRPGGLLFATILDESSWERIARARGNSIARAAPGIDFSQPLTDDFVAHGSGSDIVSFWHTRGVRRRWSFAFDVLAFEPGAVPDQTGVLLRRPESC